MIESVFLDKIKSFEGYTPTAKWDYAQFTNGYGTKALNPNETITRAEAENRFRVEIGKAAEIVERHAPNWDVGTKAALTSLTYNAGTRWISSGLGEAVRAGDIGAVRERFVMYVKAGGETLQGLVKRRDAEVQWIGNGSTVGQSDAPIGQSKPPAMSWPSAEIEVAAASRVGGPEAIPLMPTRTANRTLQPHAVQASISAAGAETSARDLASQIVGRIAEAALSEIGASRNENDPDPDPDREHAQRGVS